MEQKKVKIIGISVKENFGILKATELTFDEENRLTVVKGEVGAGKTSLNTAMRLTTQGSNALSDKKLYGDNVNLETQLLDGDKKIFVGCKSEEDGSLSYVLYTIDENGKKVKDPIIDGVKATPASYLKSLQTALTWRLNELTSENPTTQRNILLELYSQELEKKGVVFDKKSTNYVDGIIDQIEKAKEKRNYLDMKRKEVGGIADDMSKKGIDFEERQSLQDTVEIESKISKLGAEIELKKTNLEQTRENELNQLKTKGSEINQKLRVENDKIILLNKPINDENEELKKWEQNKEGWCRDVQDLLKKLLRSDESAASHLSDIRGDIPKLEPKQIHKELQFNDKGSCVSKPDEFQDGIIKELLVSYYQVAVDYKTLKDKPIGEVDTSKEEKQLETLKVRLKDIQDNNKTARAVNSFHDWKEQNEEVMNLNRDYFMKLTEINTGVDGLYICPEYQVNEKGEKIAKGNDIYLMYDGSYDTKYFNNSSKEIRKLSSYSDTQKPVICLLIQNYLLSKKPKALPYLWIDQVPIDNKTKELLTRMSEDLGLWLFVNWTGDFDKDLLKDGEILIENGQIFFNE